jgi:hypothetical protein
MQKLNGPTEKPLEILPLFKERKPELYYENTALIEERKRRDCAVVVAHKLLGGYSNAQAGDAVVFAEAVEDMLAKFPINIQKEALTRLRIEHPKWMPQPGEVYAVCERIAAEDFRRQRRETQIREQLEERRKADALGLTCYPKAIAGPVAPPPRPPPKPSDEQREACDSQVRGVWREFADGKIDEVEAERRIEVINDKFSNARE